MRTCRLFKVIGALTILSASAPALASDVSIDAAEARAAYERMWLARSGRLSQAPAEHASPPPAVACACKGIAPGSRARPGDVAAYRARPDARTAAAGHP